MPRNSCPFRASEIPDSVWVVSEVSSFGSVMRYCGECGQCLVLPTGDLARAFRCPRCRSVYVAGALVDTSTPVAAVPESNRPGSPHGPPVAAELIGNYGEPGRAPSPQVAVNTPPLVSTSAPQEAGTQRDRHRVVTNAAEDKRGGARMVQGAALAAMTASKLVTIADKIDSLLYGKRAKTLVLAAALVVVPPTLARWTELPSWLQPLALAAFLMLALVLSLARIAMFRDDEGSWDPRLGLTNIRLAVTDLRNSFAQFRAAHPKQRIRSIGSACVGAALVSLAVRAAGNALYNSGFDSWDFNWTEDVDWMIFTVGGCLWGWVTWTTHKEGQLAALLADPEKDSGAAEAVALAFVGLPTLVDCRDRSSAEAFTRDATHPLVSRLLGELGGWHPRRADTEKPYQHSLYRKLRTAVPEAEPQLEVPLRSQGLPYTGRIDILFGRCVLVEVKRRLTTSTAQKALGQIEMYVQIWQHKGPVVLVLCDTDPNLAYSFFEPPIA